MARVLLAFALFETAAVAAFLFVPVAAEDRAPERLLGWVSGAAAVFHLLVWPVLEWGLRGEGKSLRGHAREVAEHGLLLLVAVGPLAAASLTLAPAPATAAARALAPALAALLAGACAAFAVRAGGELFLRLATLSALVALAVPPAARFLSGATGSFPGDLLTPLNRPWLALAGIAFVPAVLLFRRVRQGLPT